MCYTPGVGEGWCKVILDYISELEDRVVKCQILQNVFAESEVVWSHLIISLTLYKTVVLDDKGCKTSEVNQPPKPSLLLAAHCPSHQAFAYSNI